MFGFNSAGYDIKLIKKYLFKELCKRDESPSFTVKKAGKYPCIKSESFKVLDILQFLAPGYNLKSFSKPLMTIKKRVSSPMIILLLQNNLTKPHYDTFYSTIKGCNVLEEDYPIFQKPIDQGKSEMEALQTLRLPTKPKTGLKIISGLRTFGMKISGRLLQIILNGITIWL